MVKIIMIYNFKQKKCNQKVAYLKKHTNIKGAIEWKTVFTLV